MLPTLLLASVALQAALIPSILRDQFPPDWTLRCYVYGVALFTLTLALA